MVERLITSVLKTDIPLQVSWVRIPPLPPFLVPPPLTIVSLESGATGGAGASEAQGCRFETCLSNQTLLCNHWGMAQLVAQGTLNPKAVGSSPTFPASMLYCYGATTDLHISITSACQSCTQCGCFVHRKVIYMLYHTHWRDHMILEIINKNMRKFHRWQRIKNTVRELSRLTSRELDDLGIARCDIYNVARQSVHKDWNRKAEIA